MGMYYIDQNSSKIRLLQSKRAKLSTFKSNEGKIRAIINCSFFSNDGYVVGRNQGDERNDTVDQTNFAGNNIVIYNDNSFKIGLFNSWDNTVDVMAGFCPAAVYRNGQLEVSQTIIDQGQWVPNNTPNRTALCFDGTYHFCLGTTINVDNMIKNIKSKYPKVQWIALLDSGKSTEAIENGKIVVQPSAGEQTMFNGLAFIEIDTPEPEPEFILRYPCKEGWGSQEYKASHKGLDFGYLKEPYCDIQACADGVVEFEGKYPEKFSDGITYYPIGVILRHTQFSSKYDYISIYWHLKDTIIDKGMTIKEGQVIGHRGSTGKSSGVHLHFQLLKIDKGAEVPASSQWKAISIDPTELLRVHNDQTYDEDGSAFTLKKYEEPEPGEDEKDKKIKELEAKVIELQNSLKVALEANEELKAMYDKIVNRLNRIKDIANEEDLL